MTSYLLDVNVLVALAWPEHSHHALARQWFAAHAAQGWATCPIVQAGFVRVLSNPAFSAKSVTVRQAVEALHLGLQDEAHHFWPDSVSLREALDMFKGPIAGHQQITDAYLVALAIRNGGKLATLDRRMLQFVPLGTVEVIS